MYTSPLGTNRTPPQKQILFHSWNQLLLYISMINKSTTNKNRTMEKLIKCWSSAKHKHYWSRDC
uniref:Uncharacterized protein n=1 Tax=Arundo donax TaxID=35708 RepID=A0A0A9GLM7_ARUDO